MIKVRVYEVARELGLDNRELVVGSTLFIPVFVRGALFEVGDGQIGRQ